MASWTEAAIEPFIGAFISLACGFLAIIEKRSGEYSVKGASFKTVYVKSFRSKLKL